MNEKRKQIIERILEEIRTGRMVVEDKLPPERKLAELLGEPRSIVREAVISLEAMGIISVRGREGIFLSSIEENEARTLFARVGDWPADTVSRALEIRQLLDPSAAAMAAERRSEEDVEKLSKCLENMRNILHYEDSEAAKSGAYWNSVYHSVIVFATGNSYMSRIYESILSSIEHGMSLMRYGRKPTEHGGRHLAFREHEALFNAIRDSDPGTAERIAEEHLAHTVTAMVSLGQIASSSDLYQKKLAGRIRFEAQI